MASQQGSSAVSTGGGTSEGSTAPDRAGLVLLALILVAAVRFRVRDDALRVHVARAARDHRAWAELRPAATAVDARVEHGLDACIRPVSDRHIGEALADVDRRDKPGDDG